MKWLLVIVSCVTITAVAATKFNDGSILLTAEEAEKTIQYFYEIKAEAVINQHKVIELENQIKLLKNAKCM